MLTAKAARISARMAAHMNGMCLRPVLLRTALTPDIMNGDRNCAMYIAADMRGITVETASLPALCEAAAMMHGIPAPFAKPTMNDPITEIVALGAKAISMYPMKKSAGAAKCAFEPAAFLIFT